MKAGGTYVSCQTKGEGRKIFNRAKREGHLRLIELPEDV